LAARSSRCFSTPAISSATLPRASLPEYQPDTQARPWRASTAAQGFGLARKLVAELEAFVPDRLAFG
jgi:hypothetical protein